MKQSALSQMGKLRLTESLKSLRGRERVLVTCAHQVAWMEGGWGGKPEKAREQSPRPSARPSPVVAECSLPDTVPTLPHMNKFNPYTTL